MKSAEVFPSEASAVQISDIISQILEKTSPPQKKFGLINSNFILTITDLFSEYKLVCQTPLKNVSACVGHKKDGEEFKCQIVNKNMAI